MKSTALAALSLALSSTTDAHYLFGRLILEGQWTKTWEYVREVSPKEGEDPSLALVYPNTDPDSLDLRCGRNASSVLQSEVKTATVQAGDTVGFAAGEPMLEGDVKPWMYHPGVASAWLSRAPSDDIAAYAGDGDWFKILQVTGRTEQSLDLTDPANNPYDTTKAGWGTYRLDSYNFTIPKATPSGKYLLRFEHIFPNVVDAQFYVNCAHVNIVNENSEVGTPGPVVNIPGVYVRGQSDVYFSTYDYIGRNVTTDYTPPKPEVWSG
ncbi:glycoside hydrolase [Xylariomycetidae sp. FL2044]|nr:glycoside hydrolase [Xylariomycetidae sp. FL2044]